MRWCIANGVGVGWAPTTVSRIDCPTVGRNLLHAGLQSEKKRMSQRSGGRPRDLTSRPNLKADSRFLGATTEGDWSPPTIESPRKPTEPQTEETPATCFGLLPSAQTTTDTDEVVVLSCCQIATFPAHQYPARGALRSRPKILRDCSVPF